MFFATAQLPFYPLNIKYFMAVPVSRVFHIFLVDYRERPPSAAPPSGGRRTGAAAGFVAQIAIKAEVAGKIWQKNIKKS